MVTFEPGETVVTSDGARCVAVTRPNEKGVFAAVDPDGMIVKRSIQEIADKE